MAPSSSSASWGSAKVTAGSSRTTAPNSSSCRINSPACSSARVTTTRRPASGFASVPVNVSSHQSQDTVCASGQQVLRSEEHTSELQSLAYLVCRLLLEKKKKKESDNLYELINDTCTNATIRVY